MKSRQQLIALALMLIFGMMASSLIRPVLADIPTVESIEHWIDGADTILNITVRHASPTGSHYVDWVEVDIDGGIQSINLSPQSTVIFIVQYNMGEVTDTPTVSARAHCNFHGWSNWSESIQVPEFTIVSLLLAFAVLPVIVYLLRSKLHSPS